MLLIIYLNKSLCLLQLARIFPSRSNLVLLSWWLVNPHDFSIHTQFPPAIFIFLLQRKDLKLRVNRAWREIQPFNFSQVLGTLMDWPQRLRHSPSVSTDNEFFFMLKYFELCVNRAEVETKPRNFFRRAGTWNDRL